MKRKTKGRKKSSPIKSCGRRGKTEIDYLKEEIQMRLGLETQLVQAKYRIEELEAQIKTQRKKA